MEPKLKQKLEWSFERAMSDPGELTPIIIDLIKIIVQQSNVLEYIYDSEGNNALAIEEAKALMSKLKLEEDRKKLTQVWP